MKTYAPEQLAALELLMKVKGVTFERFKAVLASNILEDVFDENAFLVGNRDAVRKALGMNELAIERVVLTVDYSQSFKEMVDAGNYDTNCIEPGLFKFAGSGIAMFDPRLFHLGKITCENARIRIQHAGYMPAAIEHLLSFGTMYPDEQKDHQILGIGSVGNIGRRLYMPCLDGFQNHRRLNRLPLDGVQDPSSLFLGVKRILPRDGSTPVTFK